MTRIVVLGSGGSLGQAIYNLCRLEPRPGSVKSYNRQEMDITRQEDLDTLIDFKPDVVFNCAAYNAVDRAEEEPQKANEVNGYAVGRLAKVCTLIGATLVHFSSNYVFDGKKEEGYSETDEPHPISKYGESKLLGETQVQEFAEKYYIVRSTWIYGAPGISESAKINYVQIMLDLAKQKPVIDGVADQFGQPTYTKDLAEASRALFETGHPYGIYHLVNEGSATWYTWAEEIFKLKHIDVTLQKNSMANFVRPAARPQFGLLKNTKFIKLRPWQEALEEYLQTL